MAAGPARGGLSGALGLGLILLGCGAPGPRALVEGGDVCDHCHMTLMERRFGGELVAATGKVTPFDDVGCLAAGVAAADSARIHSVWATDYLEPDSLIAVERLVFVRSDSIRTPMGHGIVAVRPGRSADSLVAALGGDRLTWADVLGRARAAGGTGSAAVAPSFRLSVSTPRASR